tara:strand:- start:811 stop:1617 length:807 start_codon:yes stop_codon:yes gene_type:complete
MTIEELIKSTNINKHEAKIIISHVLNCSKIELITLFDKYIQSSKIRIIKNLFQRRINGEPIAYLTGKREFYGLEFRVTPDVLIPRHETELLVDIAKDFLPSKGKALDLGTGAGPIIISIANHRKDGKYLGVDVCKKALKIARFNAIKNKVNVKFISSNWFSGIKDKFDLILCNPPYIAFNDPHLSRGDLIFEPKLALTDGSDGLNSIKKIVFLAPEYLKKGGWLFIEHGFNQSIQVKNLFSEKLWSEIQSHKDLSGFNRIFGAQLIKL